MAHRVLSACLVLATAATARADTPGEVHPGVPPSHPSVVKGVQYLLGRAAGQKPGESALIALALVKAGVPKTDPTLSNLIHAIASRCTDTSYAAQERSGIDIYEAGCVAMALANYDGVNSKEHKDQLNGVAQFLISRQNANGSWDYGGRTAGDTSIGQYALLGLWEAQSVGAKVPPTVWDKAAKWYLSVQAGGGSWNYHRDEAMYPETLSMTAAGVGSLLICQDMLTKIRKGQETPSPLLQMLDKEGQGPKYLPSTSDSTIKEAANRGISWIGANFILTKGGQGGRSVIGSTVYYFLYGLERVGALAGRQTLGKVDWFQQGVSFIQGAQDGSGRWEAEHGDMPNTCWALMFMTKATVQTQRIHVIRRLGAGTLLGGRGLPKDLSALTVAGGRVVVRAMNDAVEKMFAVLDDPNAENLESALAGLRLRYATEGAKVLKPHKDRFRKYLTDRDPALQSLGAWALGRIGELDAVPPLIAALQDPRNDKEVDVILVIRDSLQLLSRKVDGFGPPPNPTTEQRLEAARKWRAWYNQVRPVDEVGGDDETAAAATK